jgi:ribosomal protein S20
MVEVPQIKLPPVPYASAASRIRRERRRKAPQIVTVPVPAASQPSETPTLTPEVAAIGALSSGGDTSPRAQQEAAGLIAANEKRVNGISAQKTEEQKAQISKIRNFQRQAQEALSSGDTEGAKTLATKAKLLLDDIEKL